MNCLEFRRLKQAAPRQIPAEAVDHMSSCDSCAEFSRDCDSFEAELERAVAVPVDSTLAQRVLLNHKLRRNRRSNLWKLAAAAAVPILFALGIAYRMNAPDPALAIASIDHVLAEPVALHAHQTVTEDRLKEALALSGALPRDGLAAEVSFLKDCPVPGGIGKHIVLRTALGTVTLITMPARPVSRRIELDQRGLNSVILPAGRGSFAIVTDSGTNIAAVEKMIDQQIIWRG
jgi:hypothetical protein